MIITHAPTDGHPEGIMTPGHLPDGRGHAVSRFYRSINQFIVIWQLEGWTDGHDRSHYFALTRSVNRRCQLAALNAVSPAGCDYRLKDLLNRPSETTHDSRRRFSAVLDQLERDADWPPGPRDRLGDVTDRHLGHLLDDVADF